MTAPRPVPAQAETRHWIFLNSQLMSKEAAPRGSGQLGEAMSRIARLEAENQRLEAENQRLLEQFVVWGYNAHTRGLDKDFLSQPLPRVNRGQFRQCQRSRHHRVRNAHRGTMGASGKAVGKQYLQSVQD